MGEHLSNIAKILEDFFKGLSECGLMTNYMIQLQSNDVSDSNVDIISKVKWLIERVIKQLQNLLSSTVEKRSVSEKMQNPSETELVIKDTSSTITDSCVFQLIPLRWNTEKNDRVDCDSFKEIIFDKPQNPVSVLKPFIVAKKEKSSKLRIMKKLNVDNVVQIIVETSHDKSVSNCINNNDLKTLIETPKDELKCGESGGMETLAEKKDLKISRSFPSTQPENNHSCDICKKVFTCVVGLEEHFRRDHSGVGCFPCQTCGRRLTTRMNLARHQSIHNGGQSAVCKFCGKAFSRADYLRTHYASHIGKRKFACPHCPRKFNCSAHLKTHEKIHSGVKEHVCDTCGKGFGRKDKLKEHVLRHLNVKRFSCHVCQKHYAEARDLKKHLTSHAPPVP